MFSQFFKNPLNGIDIGLVWVIGINEDIIEINNDKNIKFLGQNLIDITLEGGRCIKKPKKYYLVLEVAVSSLGSCFPFIVFFNPYLMISTYKIKLGELFGPT